MSKKGFGARGIADFCGSLVVFVGLLMASCGALRAQSNDKNSRLRTLLLQQTTKKNADIGVYIGKISSDSVDFSFEGQKPFCPASVTKLITTASAFRLLGANFAFETEIAIRGKVKEGVLYGDLVIRGGGDPTLFSEKFPHDKQRLPHLIAEALSYRGIRKIEGSIVVDASRWTPEGFNTTWDKNDYGKYYAPGVYAVNCFDNKIELRLNSMEVGSYGSVAATYPENTGVRFISEIKTEKKGGGMRISGQALQNERVLRGQIAPNRRGVVLRTDLPSPALFAVSYLKSALQREGLDLEAVEEKAYYYPQEEQEEELIALYKSADLTSIARMTNVHSINLYAEALLKVLATTSSSASEVSWNEAIRVEDALWLGDGTISRNEWTFFDGSGLSRKNRISPRAMCTMLRTMARQDDEVFIPYFESLPRVGHEGTVKHILPGNNKQIYMKSGSMNGIRCYAGYAFYQGEWYVISFMSNQIKNKWEVLQTVSSVLSIYFE